MSASMENVVLEARRADTGTTRLLATVPGALADDAVRLRVDRFALTANTITYGVAGDLLGYWDFFPAADGWGRIPAIGWADVVESNQADIAVGGRYFGWFPMAQYVDIVAAPVAEGFRDDGAHRAQHAAVYRTYTETTRDPWYDATGDAEDRHALLRGLFLTGFLIDEYLAEQEYFRTTQVVVVSASSKTAIGYAQRAAGRGTGRIVGLTSDRNAALVGSVGCYDQVCTYDAIETLSVEPTVVVDMSGDSGVVSAVHRHLDGQVRHSLTVGMSHHDAPHVEVTDGPAPAFFFAPTEVARQREAWGADEYQRRTSAALRAFVVGSHAWLTPRHVAGPEAAVAAYADVFGGQITPDVGLVVSLHPAE